MNSMYSVRMTGVRARPRPTWADYWRQTTAFEADTNRSALAARAALTARLQSFKMP